MINLLLTKKRHFKLRFLKLLGPVIAGITIICTFGLGTGYSQVTDSRTFIQSSDLSPVADQVHSKPDLVIRPFSFSEQKPGKQGVRSVLPAVTSFSPARKYNAVDAASTGWWTRRYLIDYALIAGGTAGYVIGKNLSPRSRARIGPSYDPDNLLETFRSDQTNEFYLEEGVEESVPEYWIHRLLIGGGTLLAGLEALEWRSGRGSGQQFHDTVIGYAQSVAVTATVTDLTKPFFGRLRPDFTERALRFHCPDLTDPVYDSYFEDYRDQPLHEDPDEANDLLEDGRKSFISGHSSHSFNLFGYTSLAIGGRYVWGIDATSRSRSIGIASQVALMSAAVYTEVPRT